ncbi:SphA family protein [Azospirillum sp. B510]|uniref:SphA family protein n=1 Tax=Azospirillum sp. (strain B510) TaxID=137722 RepID=UPI0018D40AB4|nr:transporter [Azospirillum sp. B510]
MIANAFIIAATLIMSSVASKAIAQQLPDLVKPPAGINLGSTSFFDGFGPRETGFVYVAFPRFTFGNDITDAKGKSSRAFNDPKVNTQVLVSQFSYLTPLEVGPTRLGFNLFVPLVNFATSFDSPGLKLRDNGFNVGDLTFGTYLQGNPIIDEGRPVFSWRAEIDAIAPTGAFDKHKDLNQGSGFWSLIPYLSATYLPTENTEVSMRFNYMHNFSTDKFPNPPPIPGFKFDNGQAGQVGWVNFAASYRVLPSLALGLNGFYYKQLTENKLNGVSIADSKAEMLAMGPGAHISISEKSFLNVNLNLPVINKNAIKGPSLGLQYVKVF